MVTQFRPGNMSPAAIADAVVAAAFEVVAHGQQVDAVVRMAVLTARRLGASAVDVTVVPAHGALRKANLVAVAVEGMSPSGAFAAARTGVVGYDTLESDKRRATDTLRDLTRVIDACRSGASVGSLLADTSGAPSIITLRRMAVGERTDPTPDCGSDSALSAGEVLYAAATSKSAGSSDSPGEVRSPDEAIERRRAGTVVIGDMIRVGPDGGRRLTRLAVRMWL